MADLYIYKSVASLPAELVPNGVYAVRAGTGFDLYIADSSGNVAHKANGTEPHIALTQAEYDAIPVKDPETFYHVTG